MTPIADSAPSAAASLHPAVTFDATARIAGVPGSARVIAQHPDGELVGSAPTLGLCDHLHAEAAGPKPAECPQNRMALPPGSGNQLVRTRAVLARQQVDHDPELAARPWQRRRLR